MKQCKRCYHWRGGYNPCHSILSEAEQCPYYLNAWSVVAYIIAHILFFTMFAFSIWCIIGWLVTGGTQ